MESSAIGLERHQGGQVQSVVVEDRTASIAGGDEHGALVDKETRGVLADRTKALDHDPRAFEGHLDVLSGHLDRTDETKTRGADLVQWDAADLAREPHGAARLVLDPTHRQLVGSHIGAWDVVGEIFDRPGEGPDQPLLLLKSHFGVSKDHRFAAAVRQTRGSILQRHRARQPKSFLGADIGRHAHTSDSWSAGDIVDCNHRLETGRRPVNVHELEWAEFIGKTKGFLHRLLSRAY